MHLSRGLEKKCPSLLAHDTQWKLAIISWRLESMGVATRGSCWKHTTWERWCWGQLNLDGGWKTVWRSLWWFEYEVIGSWHWLEMMLMRKKGQMLQTCQVLKSNEQRGHERDRSQRGEVDAGLSLLAEWHHWTAVRGKWHLGCMLSYSCGGCGGPSHWNSPGISELTFFF